MTYSDLQAKLAPFGVGHIARLKKGEDEFVYLGRKEDLVFPFAPKALHPVYLENGDATQLHPEEISAILRTFEIEEKEFGPIF